MTDPYRIPPVTGPTTRAQKMRAKIGLLTERRGWRIARFLLVNPVTLGLCFGSGIFAVIALCCEPPPKTVYLIECPDREPWVSKYVDQYEGRVRAYDAQHRRVILAANCQVTEIEAQ